MSRYVLIGLKGYPIMGGGKNLTSYSILDSHHRYAEVRRYYVDEVAGEAYRRTQAERECNRLNQLERRQEAADAA